MPEISWQSDIQGKSLFTSPDQDPEHKLIKFCSFKFISPFPALLSLTMTNLLQDVEDETAYLTFHYSIHMFISQLPFI